MAAAAGVNLQDVKILSVKESRRRAGSSAVETQITVMDAASLKALGDSLGSGDLLAKINAELVKRGLPASTGTGAGVKPASPKNLTAASPATNQNQTDTLGIVLGVVLPVIFISVAAFAYRKYVYNNPAAKDSTEAGSSLVIVVPPSAQNVVPPSAKVASPPPAPPPTQSAIPIRASTPPMSIAPVSGWGNPAIFSNQTPAKTFTGPPGATAVFVPSNQTPATLTLPAGATAVFSA